MRKMSTLAGPSTTNPTKIAPISRSPPLSPRTVNSDGDETETFHTPRPSLDVSLSALQKVKSDPMLTPRPLAPILSVSQATVPGPPSIHFLPPTPAPLADPEVSPFHAEPSATASSSLHPHRSANQYASLGLPLGPVTLVQESMEAEADAELESDVESASGEAGSDDDEDSERAGKPPSRESPSRQSSFSRSATNTAPQSVARSSGSHSADGRRPLSRQSTARSSPQTEYDAFIVHPRESRPASEASFGRRSGVAESVRSGGSGYGKGGWAAARVNTPVMFMPTAANDGWAEFQQPPPRQSRFTPLPVASQPMTFGQLVNGAARTPSENQSVAHVPTGSSPSEYSQTSEDEDDDWPKPSRSYVTRDPADESSSFVSDSISEEDHQETPRSRDWRSPSLSGRYSEPSNNSVPPPASGRQSQAEETYHYHPPYHSSSSSQRPPSRPTSPRPLSPAATYSSPNSPFAPNGFPVRPSSRVGFETPSFLNPDTLTLLPEMSIEDSARTYQHVQPEHGRSRPGVPPRRSNSIFSGLARSAKGQDEDDAAENLPRRPNTAMSHHQSGGSAKWEGSSYGDGVLMESNGRAPEGNGGYT